MGDTRHQMEVAAAASGNNACSKWPAALYLAGAGATSLLFAWLASGALRHCGAMDDKEAAISCVVWVLSPLICAYLFCWTVALSPRAKKAGGVLARVTCLLVLGAAANKLAIWAPIAGQAVTVLATLYSSCACGGALAERRQRAGTERWSAAAAASSLTYQSRPEEREEDRRKDAGGAICFMVFFMAVYVSLALALVRWILPLPVTVKTEGESASTNLVFIAGPLLLVARWMSCMVGAPFMAGMSETVGAAAVFGSLAWISVSVTAGIGWGRFAGTVAFWIGQLGLVGFTGYSLAVEGHYNQLMATKRREPRSAKDASGLLDGRDSEDACSAQIDAATGLCVDCVFSKCKCTCECQIIS